MHINQPMKMKNKKLARKLLVWSICVALAVVIGYLIQYQQSDQINKTNEVIQQAPTGTALSALGKLPVQERANGTDYERDLFGSGWASWRECNVRQKILNRDVKNVQLATNGCTVISGTLFDPYTGEEIELTNKSAVSHKVQIDHVVALSNAWQTGAQNLTEDERKELANDDLELIAVSSGANNDKSDADASEWLPSYEPFRCPYVARQIAVKLKYNLWVTVEERNAMASVLKTCPDEPLPTS